MAELRGYSALIQTLLRARGIESDSDAELFLHPDYERDISDPFLILNMEKAVTRILGAISGKERIAIYGDYDCDGIPGSVVLHDFFQKIGYTNFTNYIPHRHLEGYGLNVGAIDLLAKEGVTLIITVDSGIADHEEIAHARQLGVDVIVTDHHLVQETIPPAFAVLNSKQEGDTYPDNMLCGAGVAWKLACALIQRGDFPDIPKGWEKWLLDMAGLSTIADMVPLRKENRVLAYYGLKVLQRSRRPGLLALLKEAGVDQRYITEDDVGFTIAPRVNAASRMDIPMTAFRMFATTDIAEGTELAKHLATLNDTRKTEVALMMKEARAHLRERELREVIVIGSPKWRVGIVGLAANQLAEEFDRPAFVWGREGSTIIKGSCRSNGTVNLLALMMTTRDGVFIDRGGHEASGGFSVSHEAIHTLEDALVEAFLALPKKEKQDAVVAHEAELSLGGVNRTTYREVEQLAPFGVGNPKPIFLFPRVTVRLAEHFGKTKNHLRLDLIDEKGDTASAIGFFLQKDSFPASDLSSGSVIDLLATLELSRFRGREELRLRIVDIVKATGTKSHKKKS